MRKILVIAMTTFGMTLLILLGYIKPVPDHLRTRGDAVTEQNLGTLNPTRVTPVTLQAVVAMDDDRFQRLKQVTEQFEAERTNVDVQLKNVNVREMDATYRTLASVGEGPDAMLVPISWVRPDAALGRLAPLDEFVSAEQQSQWFDSVLGAVQWNSYIWGVPAYWDPFVFVQRVSVSPKNPGSVAEWMNVPGSDTGIMVRSDELGYAILADLLGVAGGGLADLDDPIAATAPQNGAQSSLVKLRDLKERGAEHAQDAVVSVRSGKARWAFVRLSEAVRFGKPIGAEGFPLSIAAPVPSDAQSTRRLPPFGGSAFVLSSSTKQAPEAIEWILYVTQPSEERDWSTGEAGGWPVRRSAFEHLSTLGGGTTIDVQPPPVESEPEGTPLLRLFDGNESRGDSGAAMRFLDGISSEYGVPYFPLPGRPPL